MATTQNPAIDLLVGQIEELERKANAYRVSVNVLCEKDGLPPMFPDDGSGGGGRRFNGEDHQASAGGRPAIGPDTFHGKPQQTAVREFFAIRRAADPLHGPAKPDEILSGLRAGGYVVQAKSDENALVGLRAMLRKRTAIFYKLPNGTWGLREWYPNAKPPKDTEKGAPAAPAKDGESEAVSETPQSDEVEAADTTEASAA
jgi:hypothetical protein